MKAADALPSITLEITKGPREGNTFTYHPTTDPVIRIGRVVRGNTLAIKDSGISSKHLTLQFHPNSANWILTDLDSSNGTFVNGSAVGTEPGKGYVVADGDRVKIGEWTDFVCRVWGGGVGGGLDLRRNLRRRGNLGEDVRILGEIGNGNGGGEEGGVLGEKRPVVRRRGPRTDGGVSKEVRVGCQWEAKGKENGEVVRVAEGRKFGRLKKEVHLRESEMKRSADCLAVAVEESKRRGGRKDEFLKGIVVKCEPLDEPVEVERAVQVVENVAAATRPSTRRTRGRPKKDEQLLDKVLENVGLEGGNNRVVSTKTRTGLRSQRKNGENVRAVEESERLDVIEEVGDGASEEREDIFISNSIQVGEVERARDLPDGNQDFSDIIDPGIQKGSNVCDDTDIRIGTGSESKADEKMTEQVPDLSKITVRKWLDWLEVNLPKQIIAETEKLIAEMRLKARRVKEYRAEHMMRREVKYSSRNLQVNSGNKSCLQTSDWQIECRSARKCK